MRANFQFLVPSTTLGADGIGQNFNVSAPLSLTFVNLSSSTSATISLTDEDGRTQTYTVLAGLSYGPSVSLIRTWAFTGSGATVAAIFTSPQTAVSVEALKAMVVSISGTVNTDVGQNSRSFSGGTAGTSGVWTLTVLGIGAIPAVNSNSLQTGDLASGQVETYTLAVVSGTRYTVSGCTALAGWISVS